MSAWLDMGEYSAFVWSCFANFFAYLVWDLVQPAWRQRCLQREIALRARRDASRTGSPTQNPIP